MGGYVLLQIVVGFVICASIFFTNEPAGKCYYGKYTYHNANSAEHEVAAHFQYARCHIGRVAKYKRMLHSCSVGINLQFIAATGRHR